MHEKIGIGTIRNIVGPISKEIVNNIATNMLFGAPKPDVLLTYVLQTQKMILE